MSLSIFLLNTEIYNLNKNAYLYLSYGSISKRLPWIMNGISLSLSKVLPQCFTESWMKINIDP